MFEASEALQKMEGMKKIKSMLFHQYSWNSEVETTWISLIGWHHKTSSIFFDIINLWKYCIPFSWKMKVILIILYSFFRQFVSRGGLNEHVRSVHTRDTVFQCSFCPLTFTTQGSIDSVPPRTYQILTCLVYISLGLNNFSMFC